MEKNSTWEFCIKKKQGEDGIFACQKKYGCEKALTTNDYGMWFLNLFNFKFVGWTDSDQAVSLDNMKSNLENCFSFGSGAVIWSSKNQETVALSSTEAEYVAEEATTRQVLCLRKLLANFCVEQVEATDIAFHGSIKKFGVCKFESKGSVD